MSLRVCLATLASTLLLASCGPTGVTCATGVICPLGSVCTADGLGCAPDHCGDGRTDVGEECDDGNHFDDDPCRNDCTRAACGDGVVNRGFTPPGADGVEVCDDGNTTGGDGCDPFCHFEYCGDGVVSDGEDCDDRNLNDRDECRNNCHFPRCGDGFRSDGETCDTGGNSAGCDLDCTYPRCGDGLVNPLSASSGSSPEACDDGNVLGGDGCSALCQLEFCGDAVVEAEHGEQCDDGNADDLDACRNDCQLPRCGDGVASASEACDTGTNTATCDFDCTAPSCGDGVVNFAVGEQCDDGNADPADGCNQCHF